MYSMSVLQFLFDHWLELVRVLLEITLIMFFVSLKFFRRKQTILALSEKEVEKLIQKFSPVPLINTETENRLKYDFGSLIEMADYDIFNMKNMFKKEMKQTIREYGVGTCGPPGFYGTLDIHLDLEKRISVILGTDAAMLYSNSFTCINSVITCFCKHGDVIFYHRDSNEAILRGLYASKSITVEFDDGNLEDRLRLYINKKRRNFVIVEGLFRNTGQIFDLPHFIELKKKYPLRLIVDESLSIPLLSKQGISKFYNQDIGNIDIIIGSFAHAFCSTGAFVAGNRHVIDYQRLLAPSYCFSASMPGYLARFLLLALGISYKTEIVREIHEKFKSENFLIISDKKSPILVIVLSEKSREVLERKTKKCDWTKKEEEFIITYLSMSMASNKEKQASESKDQEKNHLSTPISQITSSSACSNEEGVDKEKQVSKVLEEPKTKEIKSGKKSNENILGEKEVLRNKTNQPSSREEHTTEFIKEKAPEKKVAQRADELDKNVPAPLDDFSRTIQLSKILGEFDLSSTDLDKVPTKISKDAVNMKDYLRIAKLITFENKIREFAERRIRVGLVLNPEPGIRICVKNGTPKKDIEALITCMNEVLK